MPLDTISNVRRELGRLYRASLSGKLESAEGARLAFLLKEVRRSLEAEAAAPDDVSQGAPINFTILSVPRGRSPWSATASLRTYGPAPHHGSGGDVAGVARL